MFALPPPGYARTEGDTILLTGVGDNVAAAAADGLLVVGSWCSNYLRLVFSSSAILSR